MGFSENLQILDLKVRMTRANVLIWGPGDKDENYPKRVELRDGLRERFPKADIQFSEEVGYPPGLEWLADRNPVVQQVAHLETCLVCIVLDVAKGPGEEIATFLQGAYGQKLFVLTPERFKDSRSFPAAVRERGSQEFFSDEEFTQGKLVDRAYIRIYEEILRQRAMHPGMDG